MFLLDLYRFCESRKSFDRQELAKFIYVHRDCERFAKSAGCDRRMFASCVSKEFLARSCALGYMNLDRGVASAKGAEFRPFTFEFKTLNGLDDEYVKMMVNIGEMSDDELFR